MLYETLIIVFLCLIVIIILLYSSNNIVTEEKRKLAKTLHVYRCDRGIPFHDIRVMKITRKKTGIFRKPIREEVYVVEVKPMSHTKVKFKKR